MPRTPYPVPRTLHPVPSALVCRRSISFCLAALVCRRTLPQSLLPLCFACIRQYFSSMSLSLDTPTIIVSIVCFHAFGNISVALFDHPALPQSPLLLCVACIRQLSVALIDSQWLPQSSFLWCFACIRQHFSSMSWSRRTPTFTVSIAFCMYSAAFQLH